MNAGASAEACLPCSPDAGGAVAVEVDALGAPNPPKPLVVPEPPNKLFGCSVFFSSSAFFSSVVGLGAIPKVNGAEAAAAGVVVDVVVESVAAGAPKEKPLIPAGADARDFSAALGSEVDTGAAPNKDPDGPVPLAGGAPNENGAGVFFPASPSFSFAFSLSSEVVEGGSTPVFWKMLELAKKFGTPPPVVVAGPVEVVEVFAGEAKGNAGAGAGALVEGVPAGVVEATAGLMREKGRAAMGASLSASESSSAGAADGPAETVGCEHKSKKINKDEIK